MKVKIKTLIILILATLLSWFGFTKIAKQYFQGKYALAEAQKLVTNTSNINHSKNLDELKAKQAKLQETIAYLETIPNLPGLPYQQARKDLILLNYLRTQLESKLKIEVQADLQLDAALQLDSEAAKIIQKQPFSITAWQNAKNKWQKNNSGELVMRLVSSIIKQFIESVDKALIGFK